MLVDSLLIEVGLDPSKLSQGARQAIDDLRKFENEADRRAAGVEASSKSTGDAIKGIKTQALELFAIFTGGKGIIDFTNYLTHSNAQLGRLDRNLGISASTINKWQGAARIFGGDAASMAQSFTSINDAVEGFKIGAISPLIAEFRNLSSAGGTVIDINKGIDQTLLDIAENLKKVHDQDPARAGLLGRRLGLDPALFDLLIRGREGAQQVLDYVNKIGVATKADTDAFGELEKRMSQMGLKAESLGRKVLGGESGGASRIVALADELNKPFLEARPWDAIFGWGQYAAGSKDKSLFSTPASGQGDTLAWRSAIASIESRGSGGYSAVGPITASGDRAYGKYQVMGSNIGPWSQAALGRSITPQEFMASPDLQDRIFDYKFGQYVKQFGNPQDAASAWLTGKPLATGANLRDQNGTSGAAYAARFTAALGGGSSTVSTVNINGPININAGPGADGRKMGEQFISTVKRQSFAAQANSGQN